MDESTNPLRGGAPDPTARDAMKDEPPTDNERTERPAPGGTAHGVPPGSLQIHRRDPPRGQVRRVLPWIITGVAVLAAAVGIGVLVVNEASEPKPVAQLTPQGRPDEGAIAVDDETALAWGVTAADFESYGLYGELQIWATATPEAKLCLAVVADSRIVMGRCSAPTLDPVADVDFPSDMFPPAPSGEPTSNVRFVLHDDTVDVYLAPNPQGGYY